ncbi:unnamed protein product [Urochloa humidicola]
MEAAPSAKPGREPPPVPPNYVSLRHLQELRLKEKEEQERRRREEEEEAAAAARREAEKAAMAAAIKGEAALKAEAKRRAASWEASGGARERHRGGKAQGQGNQWVAVAHQAPASNQWPAGKWEAAIGGGHGEKGPDDAPNGGGKPRVKGKGKGKLKLGEAATAPPHGGKPAEVVPASPCGGGKPENKSESNSKAKGKIPGNQADESSSSGGPGGPAEAAILSSRDRSRRGRPAGGGGRSGAETRTGIAPAKTAGPPPPPPRGVRSDDTGRPKPPAPRRADAVAGGDSPDGKKAGPSQPPPASAADGSSKPTSGGELRKTVEVKPGGLVEGQRRPVVVAQAVAAELNPRVARCSAAPLRGRGNETAQQHGRVWVPKAAASAAGSSAGAGLNRRSR